VCLWLGEVGRVRQLPWDVCAIEAIRIDKRQLSHAHSGQAECDPAAESAASNDRDVRSFHPRLVVTGHCRLTAEEICLGHVRRRRKS
jgi:hypothetical protein